MHDVVPLKILEATGILLGGLGHAHDGYLVAVPHLAQRHTLLPRLLNGTGDRVAVRAGGRIAERLGQPILDLRGDRVFQLARLMVRPRPIETEHVGQLALREPVTADQRFYALSTLVREEELLALANRDQALAH